MNAFAHRHEVEHAIDITVSIETCFPPVCLYPALLGLKGEWNRQRHDRRGD